MLLGQCGPSVTLSYLTASKPHPQELMLGDAFATGKMLCNAFATT